MTSAFLLASEWLIPLIEIEILHSCEVCESLVKMPGEELEILVICWAGLWKRQVYISISCVGTC